MTNTPKSDPRLDRASDTALARKATDTPWSTQAPRGALRLDRDAAQHRRYHSLFEDMLN